MKTKVHFSSMKHFFLVTLSIVLVLLLWSCNDSPIDNKYDIGRELTYYQLEESAVPFSIAIPKDRCSGLIILSVNNENHATPICLGNPLSGESVLTFTGVISLPLSEFTCTVYLVSEGTVRTLASSSFCSETDSSIDIIADQWSIPGPLLNILTESDGLVSITPAIPGMDLLIPANDDSVNHTQWNYCVGPFEAQLSISNVLCSIEKTFIDTVQSDSVLVLSENESYLTINGIQSENKILSFSKSESNSVSLSSEQIGSKLAAQAGITINIPFY